MADRIMLLDGNSLINRAFYGLNSRNPLTAPDGTPTGALYAFMNMLLKYLEEIKPSYACAAFDLKEPTFRHKSYDQYKGTRKPMPDDLAIQIPLLKELLDSLGIPRYEIAGYEADDILGTLAFKAEMNGLETVMVTGDKDSFQLVTAKTTVYQPVTRKGKTETQIVDVDFIRDKYNVSPKQLIDVKAIMGDSSDNIPGVRGIGEKGAISLISQYGSLEEVYKHIDDVTSAHAKKLLESLEMAQLSYHLAKICISVPVKESIDEWLIREPDKDALYNLFLKYGFRSLIDKYELNQLENVEQGATVEFSQTYENLADLSGLLKCIKNTQQNADSTELIICHGGDSGSYYAAVFSNDENDAVVDLLLDRKQAAALMTQLEILCSDGKFSDVKVLVYDFKNMLTDIDFIAEKTVAHDVMIAGYLLNQLDGKPDFCRLYQKATGKIWNDYEVAPMQLEIEINVVSNHSEASQDKLVFTEEKLKHFRKRAEAIREIARTQTSLFAEDEKLFNLMYKIEMPLLNILRSMEKTGFLLDKKALDILAEEMTEQLADIQIRIYEIIGEKFNLNSPKQLGVILFDKLGLSTGKKRSGGNYSTDADELERLSGEHPVIEHIITFRQISKLKSTFVDGLSRAVNKSDGRVRTTFSQVQTATGRLSSSEPNLQNIPIRTEAGSQLRKVFLAPSGKVLLDADYSQIELRLLAHLSQDEAMLEAFNSEQDIHMNTACSIFGLPPEMISSDQRAAAKTVNFSIVYGISDYGLARDLHISLKKAHEYISGYNARYPGVRTYLESLIEYAHRHGYVETLLGRRRYIPELKSSNRNIRMFGERAAMNAPVQGTAADMIKVAMVNTVNEFRKINMDAKLILQVHDELIVEVTQTDADRAALILRQCMEKVLDLSVPMIAEVHIGKNWAECK